MDESEVKRALDRLEGRIDNIQTTTAEGLNKLHRELARLRQGIESPQGLMPRFVESSPSVRTYGEMIDSMVERGHLEGEAFVMGHFDQQLLDKLLRLAKSLRIISPTDTLKTAKNKDALTRISKAGAQVRLHDMLHARIFCVPVRRFLIVGSGDLQTACLGGSRFDAGIWTNHSDVIKSAMDFFNRVWEESRPLEEVGK